MKAMYFVLCGGGCKTATELSQYAAQQQRSTRAPSAAACFVQRASCGSCGRRYGTHLRLITITSPRPVLGGERHTVGTQTSDLPLLRIA